jgi:putative phosphoribosyl transferase
MHYAVNMEVDIPVDGVSLRGDLVIPERMKGMVLFSHGSGSSRKSVRNRAVASFLHRHDLGTLLFDLLTPREDADHQNRFEIGLLTRRLVAVTLWLAMTDNMKGMRIGYFGASTGAASALCAATMLPEVAAVVSRGGRPDLAGEMLTMVKCPTLLIVGGLDVQVLELNRSALKKLECIKDLVVVEGATHLFEEEGKMDEVARLAAAWFSRFLVAREPSLG